MKDAPLSDMLIQDSIKTENQFMAFSGSSWQYFPDIFRSIGAYMIFYQGGPIYHGTHVPVTVAQSSAESEYNAAYTAVMALLNLRVLIHQFLTRIHI